MNNKPLLTIAIPTYNRLHHLKETLTILFSTMEDDVEIWVSDNCSTDGTWDYLQSVKDVVNSVRQPENVGHDGNLLNCLQLGTGRYVWTLSDDDRICYNWYEHFKGALKKFTNPEVLFFRAFCSDYNLTNARSQVVEHISWSQYTPDAFLDTLGHWTVLGSSMIADRESIDLPAIRRWSGTNVLPAAVILKTVFNAGRGFISDANLMAYRPGNSGGYDGIRNFSKNMLRLFDSLRSQGLSKRVRDKAYNDVLRLQITYFIRHSHQFPVRLKSILSMMWYGKMFRDFYTCVLPVLLHRTTGIDTWLRYSPVANLLPPKQTPQKSARDRYLSEISK